MKIEVTEIPDSPNEFILDVYEISNRCRVKANPLLDQGPRLDDIVDQFIKDMIPLLRFKIKQDLGRIK